MTKEQSASIDFWKSISDLTHWQLNRMIVMLDPNDKEYRIKRGNLLKRLNITSPTYVRTQIRRWNEGDFGPKPWYLTKND